MMSYPRPWPRPPVVDDAYIARQHLVYLQWRSDKINDALVYLLGYKSNYDGYGRSNRYDLAPGINLYRRERARCWQLKILYALDFHTGDYIKFLTALPWDTLYTDRGLPVEGDLSKVWVESHLTQLIIAWEKD